VLFVSLGLLLSGGASAATLPLATFSVSLTSYQDNYYMSGNSQILNANVLGCLGQACSSATGTASKTLNGVGDNVVSVSGSSAANPDGSTAEATIDYYFEAVGPANTGVAFDILAAGGASETGNGTSFAHLYLNGSSVIGEPGTLTTACSSFEIDGCGSIGSAFFLNSVFGAQSNTVQELVLEVSGDVNPNGGTFMASVDPTITIDPSFLAANPGFTLEFSSNVTQNPVSAVPLPAALPLFAAGLGAFGLMGRRKWRDARSFRQSRAAA
jgi:hypothetical protein